MSVAIEVSGLGKRFRLYEQRNQSLKSVLLRRGRASFEEFWALRGIDLEIAQGQTFGLIGHNGSGKSTLLKCMARILVPEEGGVKVNGRMSALLELGTGFHPELSGRENIFLNGSILGLKRRDIEKRLDDIVAFAELERFIDSPVKNYSSGMYVRLGFAIAINVEPEVLLVDEVLAVGDEAFQQRCMERFDELRSGGRTVVLVSHSMASVGTMCDTVALLDHGKLVVVGSPKEVIEEYLGEWVVERDGVDGGVRWGTGEVVITSVDVLDLDGERCSTVRHGDPVTFRFHYESSIRAVRPMVLVVVHHLTGTLVANPNNRELNQATKVIEGVGYFDYVVPALALIPGTYDLSGAILDETGATVYDRRQRVLRFHVDFATDSNQREVSGLTSLGGRFGGDPFA